MATMAQPCLSPPLPAISHAPLNTHSSRTSSFLSKSPQPPSRRSPANQYRLLASYEQFSALRSTHEAPSPRPMDPGFRPVCDGKECGFNADTGYGCQECAQQCEDASCLIPLTSQCTDQCVVVACNDAHHDALVCDQLANAQPCGKECSGDLDCTVFDQLLQCCNDYHFDPADMRPYVASGEPPDYAFMTEAAIESYLATGSMQMQVPSPRDPISFPPMDSASSTPQLVPSPVFEASPSPFTQTQTGNSNPSPNLSNLPSPSIQAPQPTPILQCKWSGCFATFNSLSELVGHVNLQHLRLPSPPTSVGSTFLTPSGSDVQQEFSQQPAAENSLACLWGDCQLYPSNQSIPGPSSGNSFNVMDLLASHLLQDHLGLSTRIPNFLVDFQNVAQPQSQQHSLSHDLTHIPAQPSSGHSSAMSKDAVPDGSPPTPVPEHDCSSSSSHVCRWKDCGNSFASCDALTEHIASAHVGSGRAHYDCFWEGCTRNGDSGFASKQKISRHMQSHTGHRPFQCKVCRQNFSEAATLAQHMRRHTQEKPYVCDHPGCGKAFAIAGALTIHKRTHNGSKPFKCTYCDRAFSESSNLSKHLRTHTGARPYPCTVPGCNKSFARPDQLARHTNVHKRKAAENSGAVAIAAV